LALFLPVFSDEHAPYSASFPRNKSAIRRQARSARFACLYFPAHTATAARCNVPIFERCLYSMKAKSCFEESYNRSAIGHPDPETLPVHHGSHKRNKK